MNDKALRKCTGDESLCDYEGGFPPRDWNGSPASCPQKRSSVGQGIRTLGPRVRLTGSQERHLLRPWRATQARGLLGVTRFLLAGTEH